MTTEPTAAELVAAGLERREARWLLEEFGADPARLAAAVARRQQGEPLQYIVGHWPFRGLDLDLDSRVLIPRPETEELVGVALDVLAARPVAAPTLLDLGCGSGAIGLALLSELAARGIRATLIAVDVSPGALAVARRNARKHELTSVSFLEGSWYEALDASLAARIDLIVANPPYVGAAQYLDLDPVIAHEPRGALVAADARGVPGLADLVSVVEGAPHWLAAGGALVVEHGDGHREALRRVAYGAGLRDLVDHDDLAGKPRILVAHRP